MESQEQPESSLPKDIFDDKNALELAVAGIEKTIESLKQRREIFRSKIRDFDQVEERNKRKEERQGLELKNKRKTTNPTIKKI